MIDFLKKAWLPLFLTFAFLLSAVSCSGEQPPASETNGTETNETETNETDPNGSESLPASETLPQPDPLPNPVHSKATYRIMSYNLACLVSDEPACAEAALRIFHSYHPDIMGLQECKKKVYNAILQYLPDTYANAVPFHENGTTVNYTPIFYNTEKFTLVDADLVWLRGRFTGTNTKSLTWAVLEDKAGEKFALINFHGAVSSSKYEGYESFTAEQHAQQALTWRLDNVLQIIETKDAIIQNHGQIPIMVTGDYNFNRTSEPFGNMTAAGFYDAEQKARISKTTGYKTSFSYGSTAGSGLSIDHIMGWNGIDFVVHVVVRNKDVWTASDHCPVYVDFNITKP